MSKDAEKDQARKDALREQIREFLKRSIPKKVFSYDHEASSQFKKTVDDAEKAVKSPKSTVKKLSDLVQQLRVHYAT